MLMLIIWFIYFLVLTLQILGVVSVATFEIWVLIFLALVALSYTGVLSRIEVALKGKQASSKPPGTV